MATHPVARSKSKTEEDKEPKWTQQLEHQGVLFPPEYTPHGVKMLYDGAPVDLAPEAEEVATMYASMRDTDYMNKPTFIKNFWEDWKAILGPNHVIKASETVRQNRLEPIRVTGAPRVRSGGVVDSGRPRAIVAPLISSMQCCPAPTGAAPRQPRGRRALVAGDSPHSYGCCRGHRMGTC